jgi:pimeloyl-ACP methyl ester carboxylesterase
MRGEGEPLVVILGLANDISEVGAIIDWLAQRYRVLAFDNRGAGRTDKPDAPYSIEMMADDTAGLMSAVGIEYANILGISLGGRIALSLALQHPASVDKLALVSTSARVLPRGWRFRILGLISSAPILRSKYPQPRYAFIRQRDASTTFNCTDKLPEIQAPTAIMHGKNDKTAPFALAEEMHAGIHGSKLLSFAGGHIFFLFRERQRFLDAIADFLGN